MSPPRKDLEIASKHHKRRPKSLRFEEENEPRWFSISLFCLTFSDADLKSFIMNLLSIFTSSLTMLQFLYIQSFVVIHLHRMGELCRWKQLFLLLAYIVTCCTWCMCMARLSGAWICESHILNLESGCLTV